jgi:6-phosphogluconolactonase (cycloisomerase 2 family)
MRNKTTILKVLVLLLVTSSLVTCSKGPSCLEESSGATPRMLGMVPMDRAAAAAASGCPTGVGPSSCSTTQTPTATLYAMNSTGTFLPFDISSTTAPLVQICNTVAGTLGVLAVAQPVGIPPFLYVLNASGNTGTIGAFSIAGGSSATLTAVTGQPFPISADNFTTGVRIKTDPLGEFVFVTNQVTGKIHVFQIDLVNQATLGALTEVLGSPFSVPNASWIALDPSDSFAYVTDPVLGQIDIYDFNTPTTGALTLAPIAPNPMPITSPGDFPNFAHSAATTLGIELLYTANASSVTAYDINADASLTLIATYTDAATDNIQPVGIAIDGAMTDLYVRSANQNGILGYLISSTGSLSLVGTGPLLTGLNTNIHDITIFNETLYVQEGNGVGFGGTINPFAINTSTGVITPIPQTTTFTVASNIVTANTQ